MIEDHTVKSDEHEMRVDGQFMKEKEVTTFIDGCKDKLAWIYFYMYHIIKYRKIPCVIW